MTHAPPLPAGPAACRCVRANKDILQPSYTQLAHQHCHDALHAARPLQHAAMLTSILTSLPDTHLMDEDEAADAMAQLVVRTHNLYG